jgi:chromosome segregation ATPase
MRKEKDARIAELEKQLMDQAAAFERQIDELKIELKSKNIRFYLIGRREEILSLESHVLELNQTIRVNEDLERQLDEANRKVAEHEESRDRLQQELETASDYIVSLEEKVYKANKTSLELLKQLKDAEVEIETLKNYIIELKQRIAVYIPVKDDAVDKRLAEFINNYPERNKLKIMFMRESEGVYQFGTKRVAVRVDKDKINIRVGGGYLSIDEFLDQYTPAELEKLERKDPLKKFSEKVAV